MTTSLPRVGMLATVRNRRGLVTNVEPFDQTTEGVFHVVSVEYIDPDSVPEDTLIWEREPGAGLVDVGRRNERTLHAHAVRRGTLDRRRGLRRPRSDIVGRVDRLVRRRPDLIAAGG